MNQEQNVKKRREGSLGSFISALPIWVKIFYIVGVLSIFLFGAYIISESFADFFNRHISSVVRAALAYVTRPVPFSFAELILLLSPVIIVAVAIYASNKFSSSWRDVLVFCTCLLSVLSLFFSVFTFAFAPGYHGTALDKKLGIERREVSAEELYSTAVLLAEKTNEEAEKVYFRKQNFSIMPYTLGEMNDKLMAAYEAAYPKYPFIQPLDSRLKPVMLSDAMSYTHITGVYTFFTGEANINITFPDYSIPYTAAHELAHQRGIAREDEANFVAYLVCIESDDAYIRYSAYLNLLEYVMSALNKADNSLYTDVFYSLSDEVKYELRAYSAFFDKYRDSVASEISGVVNDTYLTIQGTPGTASYGMVVDLAVAYYTAK